MDSPTITIVNYLSLLPAVGNFGGGLLAEFLRPSAKTLNRALHAAAGIILSVLSVEVMPRALNAAPFWLIALTFVAGGGVYTLVESGIDRWQNKKQAGAGSRAWMVYLAVATDLAGDGLLIGAGAAVSIQTALVLAAGQVLADFPDAFAVVANFRDKGVKRGKRLLISASLLVPVVGTAVLAYFIMRGQSEVLKMAVLVFVAGLYTLAAAEDMLREARESADDTRWSAISFVAGFALFLIVAEGLR